jgi:signal transduction histidine kinase/CheY-like chemotaxis protein
MNAIRDSKFSVDDTPMSRDGIRGIVSALAQPVTYLGVAMLVFIYCALTYLLIADRKTAYNSAQHRAENIVRVIDQSFSHIFKSVDASLLFLRKSYEQDPSTFDLSTWVHDTSVRNVLTFDFAIADANGRVVKSSFSREIIGADRSRQESFHVHVNSAADELYIGSPRILESSGKLAIVVTRRITAPDGTFAGVIAALLDPSQLAKQVGAVDLGQDGTFGLFSFDGFVLTRVVNGNIDWTTIGQKITPRRGAFEYVEHAKSGTYWVRLSVIDNISRLVSYRVLESFSLFAVVAISETEVYLLANVNARIYWGIALLLTAAILIAIGYGATRERKLIEATSEMGHAKEALARSNQELETRVTERTAELAREMRRREDAQMTLAQTQKLNAVGQLTAGIAHDFNNLLAVIGGGLEFVEGAAARGVTAEPELIEAALRATRRGKDLVQRLLAFSRQSPLKAEPTTIDQMVLDTLRLLQRTLGAEIDIVTCLNAPAAAVFVDRNLFANALLNLALNARDAIQALDTRDDMPEGGQLIITTTCKPAHWAATEGATRWPTGEEICITISDTGVGMTEEVRNRCFEPFFTTKRDGLGSGLGLSMVHGFVEQSGGHIEIDSAVGRGTTITICLPRIDMVSQTAETDAVAGSSATGRQKIVLLVEDDPDVRVMIAAQLKQLGYMVHAVANGMEAINMIESPTRIDITMTDLVLPGGIDGVTLVKDAMHTRPDMGVLCMSGYDPTQKHRKWLKVQNIAFLEKPFSIVRLAQALDTSLVQ